MFWWWKQSDCCELHRHSGSPFREHTHTHNRGGATVLHLVVRRLSTSRYSCSYSGTELRQPPPAQHQQVNQRPQPHQHRHGHRQPPTETLHFPVRRSRRRPAAPGLLSESHLTEARKQVKQAQASGPRCANYRAQVRPVPLTARLQSARPPSLSLSLNSQGLERFSDTPDSRVHVCARACFSEGVLDPPQGLNGRAWSSTCRHLQLLQNRGVTGEARTKPRIFFQPKWQ